MRIQSRPAGVSRVATRLGLRVQPAPYCQRLMLASLPLTWMVAALTPFLSQVSQISSGCIGASVRQTCAPLSFHAPVTGIALSPVGVNVPDSWPPTARLMRAVNVLPPSRSEEATTRPLLSSACISAAEYAAFCPAALPEINIPPTIIHVARIISAPVRCYPRRNPAGLNNGSDNRAQS